MTTDPPQPVHRIGPPAWASTPGMRQLFEALGEGRFVGGAVRDTLLGRPVNDLDLAVPIPPEESLRRLEAAGIRVLPTGLAHGTVTALLPGEPPPGDKIEITTLRRDVETDGRHATVAFTADWQADAERRDFTMNALYLDREGGVWDPVGGVEDCRAGRVRFVGDPAARIREDGLRLLRLYRFQAHYGREELDEATRCAARDQAAAIDGLAGERLRAEMLKLLAAADPLPSLRAMVEDGVLPHVLPPPYAPERLANLLHVEHLAREQSGGEAGVDPLRRLSALLTAIAGPAVARRLRLSNAEAARLKALLDPEPRRLAALAEDRPAQHRQLYAWGRALYRDRLLLAAAEAPDIQPALPALLAEAAHWPIPRLPVAGPDVLALGHHGPAVGRLLRELESWWTEADFSPDRAACLVRLREIAALPD